MAGVLGVGPYRPAPYASEVQSSRGVGLVIPERKADCSGVRPSWYPFQMNVCDEVCDDPDPIPLAGRQLTIPDAP